MSSTAATGLEGYAIKGETQPAKAGQQYVYTRAMPDGSKDVYWHVEGAATIAGDSAAAFPDGNLDATERAELTIAWNPDAKDGLVLQLRRQNPESKTGVDVLADLALSSPATCTGHIEYFGPASNPASSGVHNDQFFCPAAPFTNVSRLGLSAPYCDDFIWTIKYHTVNGGVYQEQWTNPDDTSYGNFPLFAQVPTTYHAINPTILDPFTGLPYPGSSLFVPYNRPAASQVPAALAGQAVQSIDVQCTGYRGWPLCNISDEMHVYYTGVLGNLSAIAVTGPTPYCRDQPLAVSVNIPTGATASTSYIWTVSAGGVANRVVSISNSTGLDVSWVPPTQNTVLVQAQARDNSCGGTTSYSTALTITLQLAAAAPQPQNMLLNNGLCAGTSPKVVSVDAGNPLNQYEWSISGTGATLFGGGTRSLPNQSNNISIVTLDAVPVTVTAWRQLTPCGGYGPPLSTTYQIVSPTAVAPTGASLTWCFNSPRTIVLANVQPGLTYTYLSFGVMPAGSGVTITGGANGTGATVQVTPDGNAVYPTQFNFVVTATSPCSSVPQSFGTTLYLPKKQLACGIVGPRAAAPPVIYPNPTTGQVTIATEPTVAYAWVRVMDAQGQLKQEQKADSPQGVTALNVSALPTGIYLVQLFDGQHLTTQRLVKE